MMRKALAYTSILFAVLAGSPRILRADVTGVILGTVTDPSGAAVPGATVRLTNTDTGLARTIKTDTVGGYEFLAVPVGQHYRVDAGAKGFESVSQSQITLLVNQRFRADFALVVGSTTQTIEINANAVQVETTSTQLGDVIDDKKMTGLP